MKKVMARSNVIAVFLRTEIFFSLSISRQHSKGRCMSASTGAKSATAAVALSGCGWLSDACPEQIVNMDDANRHALLHDEKRRDG